MRSLLLLIALLLFSSCEDTVVVKPSAALRLEYPAPNYKDAGVPCPYTFDMNKQASLVLKNNCWLNLEYPGMHATIYLSYREVKNNNLDSLLYDAQKLTYDHTIKAVDIPEKLFVNPDNKVYGMLYTINGNAATQAQFYATDSVNHFVTGSLYFKSKPNFDSIYPAAVYLRNDIRHLMETLTWKE
ncbi:gliding motility lipoprotein GldD [Altibacter sp.]|uniref:gliding motility lipoprotein GldD n=1 Tax=Altibacter sp. TaxID=2024823 RepID=UPI00258C2A07|nr:gliding motility lipoprotein GldD [Altibacter sp.]MCW9036358.1 gliding motility lipoprotein GldD [Altibacter sp.]